MSTIVDENWAILLSAFPSGWQQLARETGAIKHQLKEFRSESDLLRVLLMHIGKGYSLRETVVIAKAAGLATLSVPTIHAPRPASQSVNEMEMRSP